MPSTAPPVASSTPRSARHPSRCSEQTRSADGGRRQRPDGEPGQDDHASRDPSPATPTTTQGIATKDPDDGEADGAPPIPPWRKDFGSRSPGSSTLVNKSGERTSQRQRRRPPVRRRSSAQPSSPPQRTPGSRIQRNVPDQVTADSAPATWAMNPRRLVAQASPATAPMAINGAAPPPADMRAGSVAVAAGPAADLRPRKASIVMAAR